MTEDQKMEVAVFRFGVIGDFVNGSRMTRAEKQRLKQEKCARKWQIPHSEKTRISQNTLERWIRVYTKSGNDLKSLCPKGRSDRGKFRSMDEDTRLSLIGLRKQMPEATVPKLVAEMRDRNLTTPGTELNLSSVYRFLHEQNLMDRAANKPQDRRKFEAEMPNDLWQSDVMHGPRVNVDGKQRKTYLIAFLDDHSRLVPHGRFYLSERLSQYLNALENALSKRGIPRKLYVDNGPAFRSRHLEQVTASLNIVLVRSKPYTPQGRGKIERFFRTVRIRFLSGIKAKTLPEINAAFDRWLEDDYHRRTHGATGMKPFERFVSNMECLRPAPENLREHFRKLARRRVAKDRTIALDGILYEVPAALIGQRVDLLFHPEDPGRIEIRHRQLSYGLVRPVDVHVNSRVRRDKSGHDEQEPENPELGYSGGKLF